MLTVYACNQKAPSQFHCRMNDAQKRFVFEHPLVALCLERSVMFPDTSVHIRLFESNKSTTARLWV